MYTKKAISHKQHKRHQGINCFLGLTELLYSRFSMQKHGVYIEAACMQDLLYIQQIALMSL